MAFIGDVFGLNSIYDRQVENVDNNNFESWPESATYGYFGGGDDGTDLSTINRLDYQVEVVSDPGNSKISVSARNGGSVQTSLYGFYVGGRRESPQLYYSQVDRLDFSTEVVSDPGTNLPSNRSAMGSCENNSYGYFAGGRNPAFKSNIDRIDFITETCVPSPIGSLPGNNAFSSGLQTNDYGYFVGGLNSPPLTYFDDIFRLQFSNETVSTLTAVLNNDIAGTYTTQCPQYGYIAGGNRNYSPDIYDSNIQRLDFSDETVQLISNKIFGEFGYGGYSSSNTYGYMLCGINDLPGSSSTSTMSRINFSNETVATVSPFSFSGYGMKRGLSGGQSQRPKGSRTYGYFGGGEASPNVSTIDRLDFSNETTSAPGNNLPQARRELAAVSSSSYGYFGGGERPGPTIVSTIDRLDFSNETTSAPGNNLPQIRQSLSAVSSSSYGYFGGGRISPSNTNTVCTINRLDFSNETTSVPGNNLSQNRRFLGAVSNNSYGYFGGGYSFPYRSTIDRLDFSNETTSAPGNNLPQATNRLAAVSSSSYGYFGGGFTPPSVCTINRLDFSNETLSLPGNGLPQARNTLAAVSN